MSKKIIALLLAAIMLIGVLAGCSSNTSTTDDNKTAEENKTTEETKEPTTDDTQDSATDAQQPATEDKRELLIATNADMMTTDPEPGNSGPTDAILYNVYSRLIKQDDAGDLQYDLITDYKLLDDQLTWEFYLRQDAVFHDGTPVTAKDVVFSIDRVMHDEAGADYTNFSPLESITEVDDYTVQIKSKEPYPIMLNLLAKGGASIIPKDYFEKVGVEGFVAAPIGSGPYELKEYIKDDHVTLTPFADYYGDKNPDWDTVTIRFIPESSTRVGELIAGNVDAVNMVIPAEWDRVNGNDGSSIVTGPSTRIYQLALKCDKEPTSDLRVRKAIDLAIDDKAIVDQILKGAGRPMLTRIPVGVSGVNNDLVDKYNYDLEEAKALMKEAGYEDGFELTIDGPTGRYTMDSEIQQAIVAMLSQINIKVNLQLHESSAYSEIFSAHTAKDGFMTCFGMGFFDASYGMIGYIGGNTEGESNWEDQEFIDLYNKAEFNMNLEERDQQMQQLQQIVADEVPYVIICQIDNCYGVKDTITMSPRLDDVWNLLTMRKK